MKKKLLHLFVALCAFWPYAALAGEHMGDFMVNSVVDCKWDTHSQTGASITRSTDGTLRIYKDNSATERSSLAGVTQTEDFDTFTGTHHIRFDTSDNTDAGFWSAGNTFFAVMTGMTIDTLAINAYVCSFSLERQVRPPVVLATYAIKDASGVILTVPIVGTNGKPRTGLVFNTTGLVVDYQRGNASGGGTSVTLTGTCSLGSFTSGCFLEKDTTPGTYQLHVPDAAFATGTDRGTITVSGVAATVPTYITYDLTDIGSAALSTSIAAVQTVVGATPFVVNSVGGILATPWRKNIAAQPVFPVVLQTPTGVAITGLTSTWTMQVSKDGAALTTVDAGAVKSEAGGGLYHFAPAQADTNCDVCTFVATGTGAAGVAFPYRYEMRTK